MYINFLLYVNINSFILLKLVIKKLYTYQSWVTNHSEKITK